MKLLHGAQVHNINKFTFLCIDECDQQRAALISLKLKSNMSSCSCTLSFFNSNFNFKEIKALMKFHL